MPKNGIVGEITVNTRQAADGRHPQFVASVTLPEGHPALPEGTILFEGTEPGTAVLAATSGASPNTVTHDLFGVLEEAVEADAGVGNVMIHGSCPADILVTADETGVTAPATAAQIKALRGIGIFV